MSETKRRRFGWHVGSSDVLGRRVRQYAVDDTGSVEASEHRHAAQVRICVDSRRALAASQVRHGRWMVAGHYPEVSIRPVDEP